MSAPCSYEPMPPAPHPRGRPRLTARVAAAGVVVTALVVGLLAAISWLTGPPRQGLAVKFDAGVASRINADVSACPAPQTVRTQDRVAGLTGASWSVWVSFPAHTTADVERIVASCLRDLPAYSEALWAPTVMVAPHGWGTGSYFASDGPRTNDPEVRANEVEFLEVDDVALRRTEGGVRYLGRAVAISRDASTKLPQDVSVLLVEMSV